MDSNDSLEYQKYIGFLPHKITSSDSSEKFIEYNNIDKWRYLKTNVRNKEEEKNDIRQGKFLGEMERSVTELLPLSNYRLKGSPSKTNSYSDDLLPFHLENSTPKNLIDKFFDKFSFQQYQNYRYPYENNLIRENCPVVLLSIGCFSLLAYLLLK